jgi:hypothetical protein
MVKLKFRASFKDNVTGGDIFSGGAGEVPVGKCITAATSIYVHGLTNTYTS